jgi:hypothetical protein
MFKLPDMLGNIDIGVVKQHISNIIITIENIITIINQGNRGVNESNILEISREIFNLTNFNVYNAKRSVARVINTIQSSIPSSLDLLSPIPSNPHAPGLSRQRAIGRPSLNILSLPPPPPPTSLASTSDEEGFGLKYRKKRSKKRSKKRANYTKRRETRSSKMKKMKQEQDNFRNKYKQVKDKNIIYICNIYYVSFKFANLNSHNDILFYFNIFCRTLFNCTNYGSWPRSVYSRIFSRFHNKYYFMDKGR